MCERKHRRSSAKSFFEEPEKNRPSFDTERNSCFHKDYGNNGQGVFDRPRPGREQKRNA
jgi:hypothetical protein